MQQEYISHFIEFTFEYFKKVDLRSLKKNTCLRSAPIILKKSAVTLHEMSHLWISLKKSEIQSTYKRYDTFLANFSI